MDAFLRSIILVTFTIGAAGPFFGVGYEKCNNMLLVAIAATAMQYAGVIK